MLLVALGAATLLGGCVSKEEYDNALAANRRMREQLDQSLASRQEMSSQTGALQAEIASRDATIAQLRQEATILENQRTLWETNFNALKEKYDAAISGKAPPEIGPITVLPAPIDMALAEFARANPDLVEYLREYGMVKIKSDLTFAKGATDVQPDAMKALAKLVEIANSEAAKGFHVYVAGHTDDIPIRKPDTRAKHPDNWYLSAHRAIAVKDVLEQAGLSPARIGVVGFGEYHPVAPNRPNNKGNEANRRVEIWIVPPNRLLTPATALSEDMEK